MGNVQRLVGGFGCSVMGSALGGAGVTERVGGSRRVAGTTHASGGLSGCTATSRWCFSARHGWRPEVLSNARLIAGSCVRIFLFHDP
jgi:hypothetical protein